MKIGISLITLNDLFYLKPCLDSLYNSDIINHDIKLFCIDNGSDENHINFLKDLNINKDITYNSNNEGIVIPRIRNFKKIKEENYDFLLELHSDMLFPKKWIDELFSIDDDNTCILQPNIIQPNGIMQLKELEDYILNNKSNIIYTKCRQVHPWLIKISKLNLIGGYYDENFSPHECEDDDLVFRILNNNLNIKTVGTSIVVHYGGSVRHKVLDSCLSKNQTYFFNKHNKTIKDLVKMTDIHPAYRI